MVTRYSIGMANTGSRNGAWGGFSAAEWWRLSALYGFVLALHLSGWGLFLYYSMRYPALAGLGLTAYLFGLRHAFDADHIAAVDDTVRLLLQKGRRPLGVGFFFSLGHSTIVMGMVAATIFAAALVRRELPSLQALGGVIGASVSGAFLWLIGLLNLAVLLGLVRQWRAARRGGHGHAHLHDLLSRRGFLNRWFGGWAQRVVNHSWQMFPLGLLFGLGFDTASEIALLATAAGAAATGVPALAVFSLPLLFAAGMSLLDTSDGVLMVRVYHWALIHPRRKLFYNIVVTALSVAVALVIGSIELLQVLGSTLHLPGRASALLARLDFGTLGYVVVALFVLTWLVSAAVWRFGRFEQRTLD